MVILWHIFYNCMELFSWTIFSLYFSNMLCMVDALHGYDEDVQNTLLQKIGSQSMDNVNNLIEVLVC